MLNLSAKRVCSRKEGGERGLVTRHLLPASQVWKIAQGIARRFGGGERERKRDCLWDPGRRGQILLPVGRIYCEPFLNQQRGHVLLILDRIMLCKSIYQNEGQDFSKLPFFTAQNTVDILVLHVA